MCRPIKRLQPTIMWHDIHPEEETAVRTLKTIPLPETHSTIHDDFLVPPACACVFPSRHPASFTPRCPCQPSKHLRQLNGSSSKLLITFGPGIHHPI